MSEPVLIVGAGVAALCVARHLQMAGRPVTLIDPQPVEGGASFGNGGFISAESFMPGAQPGMLRQVPKWLADPLGPLAIHPSRLLPDLPWFSRWLRAGRQAEMLRLARRLHRLHRTSFDDWLFLLGPDLFAQLIRRAGEVTLSDTVTPSDKDRTELELRREFGLAVEFLGPSDLQQIFPGLSPVVKSGVLKPRNGYTVSPARLCQALADRLRADGASFLPEKVVKIVPQDGRWMLLTTSNNHHGREVVLAAGVWSAKLLDPLGIHVPLTSQRGYHAMLPADAVSLGKPFLHRSRGIGMTPMLEGVRVAGTVEFGGIDGPVDERRAIRALAHARILFPDLRAEATRIWSGQRPATPDTLPILGPVPARPGLFLCFGSGTYGMTQAPAAGRLVADQVLGRTPALDPGDYVVTRFGSTRGRPGEATVQLPEGLALIRQVHEAERPPR